jgi:hypothetical protein
MEGEMTAVEQHTCSSGPNWACQFGGPAAEFNGRYYCKYHAPLDAPWRLTAETLASFVANCEQSGTTDLTGVNFPAGGYVLSNNVIATGCTFAQGVTLQVQTSANISESTCLGTMTIHCSGRSLVASDVHFLGPTVIHCDNAEQLIFTGSTADELFSLKNITRGGAKVRLDDMTLKFAPVIETNLAGGFPQDSSFSRLRLDNQSAFGDGAEARYRTIRNYLQKTRDREQEGQFYQYEKRAKRKSLSMRYPQFWFPRAISACYDWSAAYGQSYERAFVWLVGVQVAFGLLYSTITRRFSLCGSFDRQIAAFTFAQLVKPFALLSPDIAKDHLPWPYDGIYPGSGLLWTVVTAVHSILSLTLVALFLLALRWRFRRD